MIWQMADDINKRVVKTVVLTTHMCFILFFFFFIRRDLKKKKKKRTDSICCVKHSTYINLPAVCRKHDKISSIYWWNGYDILRELCFAHWTKDETDGWHWVENKMVLDIQYLQWTNEDGDTKVYGIAEIQIESRPELSIYKGQVYLFLKINLTFV